MKVISDPKYFDVSVRVGNSCGLSTWLRRTGYVVGAVGPLYFVYPNPTIGDVTIFLIGPQGEDNMVTNQEELINNISIFDKMGLPVIIQNYYGKIYSVTINVSTLSKGIYVMKINDKENHTIVIE